MWLVRGTGRLVKDTGRLVQGTGRQKWKNIYIFITLPLIGFHLLNVLLNLIDNRVHEEIEGYRPQVCFAGWRRLDNKCYRLFHQMNPISYSEVSARCNATQARPVTVNNPSINSLLHDLMKEEGSEFGSIFIGLKFSVKKNTFLWPDGTTANFTHWAKGEPNFLKNEQCVEINERKLQWNNIPCDATTRRRYACEMFAHQQGLSPNLQDVNPHKNTPAPGEFTDEMFQTALVSGYRRRKKGDITIGIPTVYRPESPWYLGETLDSLIQLSNSDQKRTTTIVILLADLDVNQRTILNRKLVSKYQEYFDSGFILTIEAPFTFYPSYKGVKRTYNHDLVQVRWRIKQNFDYAYLLYYSQNISNFYLQLEDDVVTVPNYLQHIRSYITDIDKETQRKGYDAGWACLEFSELGFIAKLFRSEHIGKLAKLMVIFYNEQPNDVLFLHFNEMMLQFERYLRLPTIFQHRGLQSSLLIKKEPLVDLMINPDISIDDVNSVLPVQMRLTNNPQGSEQLLWDERKKLIRKQYCGKGYKAKN